MNVPSYLIVSSFVIIAITMIFSIGLTETVPLYIRNEFDSLCNNYINKLSIQGCLNVDDRNNIIKDLNNIGLTDVTISDTNRKEWGSDAELIIEANYKHDSLDVISMTKSKSTNKLVYKNKIKVFGLEN